MDNSHEIVKENWSLFRAGKITLAELINRNESTIGSVKVIKVARPEVVVKAQQIFAPHSEKGCPNDPEERIPF